MLRVTVELVPYGDEKRKRILCQGTIANDGKKSFLTAGAKGDYNVRLLDRRGRVYRTARVENFPRKRKHVWALVWLALDACLGRGQKE